MPLWTVAIETIATAGSVALLCDDKLHAERGLPAGSRSAKTLAAAVQSIWQQAGKPAIALVGVATGPGSFTGLRVGAITAKTLAYAWNATLLGVHTLDAIAAQTPMIQATPLPQILQVILDAQRQELFVAEYQHLPESSPAPDQLHPWLRQQPDAIVPVNAWLESLAASNFSSPRQVTGPALNKLRDRLPPHIHLASENLRHPQAATIARLARERHRAGSASELFTLVPNYGRVSYAEEKR